MATQKRRLLVTLEPELDVLLRKLAKLRGRPQSSVVGELLQGALPTLRELVAHLEAAEKLDPRLVLAHVSASTHREIAEATQRALVLPTQKRRKRASG
jgi:hypothetical protein